MAFTWTELSRRSSAHGTVISEVAPTGDGSVLATTIFTANGGATLSMVFVPGKFQPPPPTITSLEPSSAALGSPSFTLRVHGTGFTADSVIVWNGSPEPTVYVSATELTTGVNMETAQVAIPIPVVVRTGDQDSESATFTLTDAAARAGTRTGAKADP